MFCFKIELLSVFIHENGGICTQPVAAAGTTATKQLSLTHGGDTARRFFLRAAEARTLEENARRKDKAPVNKKDRYLLT
jgi:hypothetical protein